MALEFQDPPSGVKPNVLLYGSTKVGKSWGAASAPGPILYINTDRPNAVAKVWDLNHEKMLVPRWQGLSTLIDSVHLVQGKHDYETVVLDTVGDTYRSLVEEFSGRALRPQIGYYGDAGIHIERFCRAMCENPSVHFVCVCHELPVKDEESGGMERLPFTGSTSNPTLGQKLSAMVDVVGYCGTSTDEEGETKYMAQLVNSKGRRGGDRFDLLGAARTIDLTEWFDLIAAGGKVDPPKKTTKKEEVKA